MHWHDFKMEVARILGCDDNSTESFEKLRDWWTKDRDGKEGLYLQVFMDSTDEEFERVLELARAEGPL